MKPRGFEPGTPQEIYRQGIDRCLDVAAPPSLELQRFCERLEWFRLTTGGEDKAQIEAQCTGLENLREMTILMEAALANAQRFMECDMVGVEFVASMANTRESMRLLMLKHSDSARLAQGGE